VLATGPQIDDLFEAAAWVFERPVDHRSAGPDRSLAAVGGGGGGSGNVRDDRYAAAVGDHDETRSRLVGRYTPLVRSVLTQGGLSRAAAEALESSVWSQLMQLLPLFPGHRISGWTVISTCKDVLLLCGPSPRHQRPSPPSRRPAAMNPGTRRTTWGSPAPSGNTGARPSCTRSGSPSRAASHPERWVRPGHAERSDADRRRRRWVVSGDARRGDASGQGSVGAVAR
jgi:hypothetical protein